MGVNFIKNVKGCSGEVSLARRLIYLDTLWKSQIEEATKTKNKMLKVEADIISQEHGLAVGIVIKFIKTDGSIKVGREAKIVEVSRLWSGDVHMKVRVRRDDGEWAKQNRIIYSGDKYKWEVVPG